jgi:hypothetical protein
MNHANNSNIIDVVTPGNVIEAGVAAEAKTAADPKFTAAQIEAECPPRLQQIGNEIKERLEKARKYHQQAEDHLIAVNARIIEAKSLCDDGGFNKFRERFCPQLGKSQAYVLHAIRSGKRTLAQVRAQETDRKRRTRARQKAVRTNSGTVPEKPEDALSGPNEDETLVEDAPLAPEHTPRAAKPRSKSATDDQTLLDFSARVMDLIRTTNNRDIGRFAKTSVKADKLAQLGKFLTDIANLKKSGAAQRPPTPPDDGDFPITDTPLNMKSPDAGVEQGV